MKSKTPVSKKQLLESKLRTMIRKIIKESNELDDDVREVVLYAENDHRLYNVLHKTYVPALLKFKKKGTFDRDKALKLMEYYWSNYVRPSYKKDFGDVKLDPSQRRAFSDYFLTSLEDEGYLDNPE